MRSRARKFTHSAFCSSTYATSFDCDDEPQSIKEDALATLNHKDIFLSYGYIRVSMVKASKNYEDQFCWDSLRFQLVVNHIIKVDYSN